MKIGNTKVQKYIKRSIALVCALLMLACIAAICLPHAHFDTTASATHDIDCPICGFVRLLVGAVLTAAVLALCNTEKGGIDHGERKCPCLRLCREFTPVWRKVKLSN